MVSVYRRPRPAANLKYALEIGFSFDPKNGLPLALDPETQQPTPGNLLADARVLTLRAQAIDALISHTGLVGGADPAQLQQIIDFETQLYTAQSADTRAGALSGPEAAGAQGGPEFLAQAPAARLQSSTTKPIWGEFLPWQDLKPAADGGGNEQLEFRRSVARGRSAIRAKLSR